MERISRSIGKLRSSFPAYARMWIHGPDSSLRVFRRDPLYARPQVWPITGPGLPVPAPCPSGYSALRWPVTHCPCVQPLDFTRRSRSRDPPHATRCRLSLPLTELSGDGTARAHRCRRDQPPFDRVTMDGIAFSFASWQGGRAVFVIAGTQARRRAAADVARRRALHRSDDGSDAARRLRLRRAGREDRGSRRRRAAGDRRPGAECAIEHSCARHRFAPRR